MLPAELIKKIRQIEKETKRSHNQQTIWQPEVMSRDCKTTRANILAAEVLKLMEDHKINAILVVDDDNKLVGALNMHDLLRAGVV